MRTLKAILALLMLVLSGCGDSDGQVVTNLPLDTGVELDKSEPWDLLWFSDSLGQWVPCRLAGSRDRSGVHRDL